MKVYAKNSFDRLGDDLTELILQYLTFEDKVRLECVSKQWRRLVFNKQFVIEINSNKRKALESVLKKCHNITTVRLKSIDSSELSLIGRYCDRIKSLQLMGISSDDNVLSFFRMYGHKLQELYIAEVNFELRPILQFCPNLKNIHFGQCYVPSNYFDEYIEFLPKLQRIRARILIIPSLVYINNLKKLSDKYSQTMKAINIDSSHLNTEELKTCIECIARFENLKELTLKFAKFKTEEPIDDCLSLIGQKCNKLLELDLTRGRE